MFQIGEFSKLTQVSIRMLRYYDKIGLLKPAKIDTNTHYRLYSAEQIADLNKIVFLRDLGFQTSEILNALDKWNDNDITSLLRQKRLDIENTIQTEREKIQRINLAERDLIKENIALNYNVSIKTIPTYQVLSLRQTVPDYYAEEYLWQEMTAFCSEHHIPCTDNTLTIFHNTEYKEKDVDIEICTCVAKMGGNTGHFTFRHTDAVPKMACTMVYGPFSNIKGAYERFAAWLQEHNQYNMGTPDRQIVHRGPWNETSPDNYLTEIQIPLIEK